MQLIGLTGGIATGKSTVSAMLREKGATVLDADEIAREVVAPGTAGYADVVKAFPGTVSADGTLDRKALAARVFSSPSDRRTLDGILHPRIQEAFLEKSQALADQGVQRIIYDAALLIETGLHAFLDGVILVAAPRELQIARLIERNGLSPAEAEARVDSQMPFAEKRRYAKWIIDNSGTLAATRLQVEQVWTMLAA